MATEIKDVLVGIAEKLGDLLGGNGQTAPQAPGYARAPQAGGDEVVIRLRVGAGQAANVTGDYRAVQEVEAALTRLGERVGVRVERGSVRIGRS